MIAPCPSTVCQSVGGRHCYHGLVSALLNNEALVRSGVCDVAMQQSQRALQIWENPLVICRLDVCDGSELTGEFISLQSGNPDYEPRNSLDLPQGLVSAAEDTRESTVKVDLQAVLDNIAGKPSSHS